MLGAAWFIREYLRGSFSHYLTRVRGIYFGPSLTRRVMNDPGLPLHFFAKTGRIDSYGSVDLTATMDID